MQRRWIILLGAGVTNSELTNHGNLQAQHLGTWLRNHRPPIWKIFASPLQRTRRTACAIVDAQKPAAGQSSAEISGDDKLIFSPLLIEQDFGSYEGTSYYTLPPSPSKTRRAAHAELHKQDPDFKDVESAESMAQRCDQFLNELLFPAIREAQDSSQSALAVVSHGIILSHLWRRFLLRLPKKSISISPEVTAAKGQIVLEHPGGWSNTGCLEIAISQRTRGSASAASMLPEAPQAAPSVSSITDAVSHVGTEDFFAIEGAAAMQGRLSLPAVVKSASMRSQVPLVGLMDGFTVALLAINSQEHLKGVKRARGGIGSSRYDEGQKSLDGFFKRAKK
ncbi:hypothetical protein ANO11243_026170 [Dothideomycetidae sp. 11243]|nr:hypothetical protein ANO11243_026170 [fungal sp. No.11243]